MGLLPRTFAATITIVIVTAVAAAMAMMSALQIKSNQA
jgi:ABC-type transporter Mla maintaining outer membrane lipid asymmetry permease subunit MlaE